MLEKIKNKTVSILVFAINALLATVGFLVIKNKDNERLISQKEALLNAGSIDPEILKTQNAISQDRENKLRSLNNSPKESKKVEDITTKTTKTSTPAPVKKATTKTKTS